MFRSLLKAVQNQNYSVVTSTLSNPIFNRIDFHIIARHAIQLDDPWLLRTVLFTRFHHSYDDIDSWYKLAWQIHSRRCIKELDHYLFVYSDG